MKILDLKVEQLIPYINNPRDNTDAIDKVASSIKEFGFKVPIVIDKDNVVVNGHTRLLASKKLGLETVPCIMADDLTEAQIKAFRIADNKVSEYSEWNEDLLRIELEQLEDMDFDLEELSIDYSDFGLEVELDDFEGEYNEDNDVIGEPPKVPFSKQQDVWLLGRHRLMCGSSTDEVDMDKLLDGNAIDLVSSDPPYGISIVNEKTKKVGAGNLAKNKEYIAIKGDDTTETAKLFYNIVKNKVDNIILWGGNYFLDFLPFSDSFIIWDKRGDMNSNNFADGEMAWCSFKTRLRIFKQIWNGMIREGEKEERIHPTQKPIKIQSDILKEFSKDDGNILDGFGGSGSLLIACEVSNRNCFMMEFENAYIDLIVKRYINHKQNNGEDVYLLRDGNKIPYSEIEEEFTREA